MGDFMPSLPVTLLDQSNQIANAVLRKVKNQNYAVRGTSYVDYGIEDVYSKDEVDAKVTSAYKIGGSKLASEILAGTLNVAANEGYVYNLKDKLEIPANKKYLFVENIEAEYPPGQNIGVIQKPDSYTACESGDTAVEGVTYYSYDISTDTYTEVTVTTGADVSAYYTKDAVSYVFDSFTGFIDVPDTVYTGGNGININNKIVSLKIKQSGANGLYADENGAGINTAVADTWGYVPATGTYKRDTIYFTDSTGATRVDTSGFTPDVTDVSSYYVYAKTTDGANGAFTGAEKAKLSHITPATQSQIDSLISGLISL